MKTLIYLSAFSLIGMLAIFFRKFVVVRAMSKDELLVSLRNTEPVFTDFYVMIVVPTQRFYRQKFLPWFFKKAEKMVHWFRIHILKIEHSLFNLKHYFRGKHEVSTDGHSPYWKDMKEYKEGLNEDEDNVR